MRYELKSISIWALLKVSFFINLVVGFLFGLVNAFFIITFLSLSQSLPLPDLGIDPTELSFGFLFIFYPIICAIGGAVFLTTVYVFLGLIYNLVAHLIGGLEFDLAPSVQSNHVQPVRQPSMSAAVVTPPPPPSAGREDPRFSDSPDPADNHPEDRIE